MKGLSALPVNVTDVTRQTDFAELMSLAKTGQLFIKVSGFYRSSKLTTGGYDDLESLRLLHKKCLTSEYGGLTGHTPVPAQTELKQTRMCLSNSA